MIPLEFILLLSFFALRCAAFNKYEPDWKSLDARPLPAWYDDAKFGVFIHWGVFSVPGFKSEWFWRYYIDKQPEVAEFMRKEYKPGFAYPEFAKDFTATFYNATKWSNLFEASGAKYVVLTTKHHEGYTLWPSKLSFNWNSMEVGPHRDLVGELAAAVKKNKSLKLGLYYSLYEFFNPLWLSDQKNAFATNEYVEKKSMPELRDIVETYEPEIVWSDGEAEATADYWKAKEFMTWLYNDSPVRDTVVTNDRRGTPTKCKHGDFYTCANGYNPENNPQMFIKIRDLDFVYSPCILQKHKWENCMSIDRKSWGYRRDAELSDYMTLKDLVNELITTVSCGGNLLLNIGPTHDGRISLIHQERLLGIGTWLKVNGEAIYNSKPWKVQNDTLTGDVWYTVGQNGDLYASMLSWPDSDILNLGAVETVVKGSPDISVLV